MGCLKSIGGLYIQVSPASWSLQESVFPWASTWAKLKIKRRVNFKRQNLKFYLLFLSVQQFLWKQAIWQNQSPFPLLVAGSAVMETNTRLPYLWQSTRITLTISFLFLSPQFQGLIKLPGTKTAAGYQSEDSGISSTEWELKTARADWQALATDPKSTSSLGPFRWKEFPPPTLIL